MRQAANTTYVESAIARTLTGDIYRADDRAINSVNREIFAQQQQLATRIRSIKPQVVLALLPGEEVTEAAVVDDESLPMPGSIPAPGRFR